MLPRVIGWFLDQNKTLACAESCTGGLLSSSITACAGVSSIYLGTVISYSSSVKTDLLGVKSSLIQVVGEVSEPVAKQMARGVRKKLKSDWAVSITGIAGPSGGTPDKPVGTVCFAVSGPGVERTCQKLFDGRDRQSVQKASAQFALEFLWESLHL